MAGGTNGNGNGKGHRGTSHPPEVKAAVLAALLEGQSIREVAKRFHLPTGTVAAWNSLKPKPATSDSTAQKEEIGKLILDYLEQNLRTVRAQLEFFTDKAWLKRQDASGVAVLHGVTIDKAFRLLEALEAREDAGSAPDPV